MASQSRVDRLIKVLGGEENLPLKLPQPTETIIPPPENEAATDDKQILQPIDDFLKQEAATNGEGWWNRAPKIVQPAPSSQHQTRRIVPSGDTDAVMRPAPLGMSFCPLLAVTKFPYKFVKKEFMQQIATVFFDEGKIWNREWELYSVWSTIFDTGKPILFVSESQVLALLDEINTTFPKANVSITDYNRKEGLVIDFDDIPQSELRPHFLGNSTSREQIQGWEDNCRVLSPKMDVPERTLEAFKAKLEAAAEISKNKSKAKKQQRQTENVVKRGDMSKLLTRTQRYLGLPTTKEGMKKQRTTKEEDLLLDIPSLSISGFDVTKPASGPFEDDVIFIAIDVEAFEFPPHPVTEVGIANLDTRDLHSKAPGTNGEDWQKYIKARHFRIEEHKRKTNSKFVDGCPDKFEFNNGASLFVQDRNISKTVTDCFKPPYGKDYPAMTDKPEKRKVVLVGHDINQDVNYLRHLGVSLANFSSIIDTIDTISLFRAYKQDNNSKTSLGHVLASFDLIGWHLHNAGNDAVYTLWAMLATCVKASAGLGDPNAKEKKKQEREEGENTAAEQARERYREDLEGFNSDGEDGGVAVRPGEIGAKPQESKVLYTAGGKVLDV